MQSGGNAIPLGKRKASVAFEPAEDPEGSDIDSDTDADEFLAGELDSDDFEIGSNEDSLEAPDSDDDNNSGISSDDDMPIAAERQGAAARKAAVLLKVTQSAQPSSKQARKQLQHQQEQRVSSSVSEGDEGDDTEGEQDGAEEAGAARRSSHEVRANGTSACGAIDPQHCNKAAFQVLCTTTFGNSSWSKHGSMWHADGFL